jgi:chromate reductase
MSWPRNCFGDVTADCASASGMTRHVTVAEISFGICLDSTLLAAILPPIADMMPRMQHLKVGYIVGSLSSNSINRLLANALVKLAPEYMEFSEIEFGDLPLYTPDYDADYPDVAKRFKQSLAEVHAVLFVTPEYNRSIPGGLKNAIDWASRPYGENSFSRKPSAIIGASPGAIGTAIAQQSLRSVLSYCNSPQMNAIEAYIQFKPGMISDQGEVTDERTRDFLQKFVSEFGDFIRRVCVALNVSADA